MQAEYADCKQDLLLFLFELITNIDVSKFPADSSNGLNRYISVCLRNKYIELQNKNRNEYNYCFLTKEETVEKRIIEKSYMQSDFQINIEFEISKNLEMEEALNLLSPKQKNVIIFKYLYGFNDVEIGEMFNISRMAVNKLKNRAFETLKNNIGGDTE
jgi:RNA polymerase sigma factor (sigma-70 family)